MLGYPVLSVRSIPRDREYLDRYYREELDKGTIKSPLEISYVWPENYSVNSAQKVWRRPSRRITRTWSCSTCRPSSAGTTRRPSASSTAS